METESLFEVKADKRGFESHWGEHVFLRFRSFKIPILLARCKITSYLSSPRCCSSQLARLSTIPPHPDYMGRESREKAAEKEFCRPSFSPNKKHWKAAGNTLPEKRNICFFLFELQSPGFHTGMESFTNSERNKRKGTSDSEKKKKNARRCCIWPRRWHRVSGEDY